MTLERLSQRWFVLTRFTVEFGLLRVLRQARVYKLGGCASAAVLSGKFNGEPHDLASQAQQRGSLMLALDTHTHTLVTYRCHRLTTGETQNFCRTGGYATRIT